MPSRYCSHIFDIIVLAAGKKSAESSLTQHNSTCLQSAVMHSPCKFEDGVVCRYDIKGSVRNRKAAAHDSVGKDLNFDEEPLIQKCREKFTHREVFFLIFFVYANTLSNA